MGERCFLKRAPCSPANNGLLTSAPALQFVGCVNSREQTRWALRGASGGNAKRTTTARMWTAERDRRLRSGTNVQYERGGGEKQEAHRMPVERNRAVREPNPTMQYKTRRERGRCGTSCADHCTVICYGLLAEVWNAFKLTLSSAPVFHGRLSPCSRQPRVI